MSESAALAKSAPPTPDVVRRDFPAWLPAMMVKELRQGMRTRGFVGAFIGGQVAMALLMSSFAAAASSPNSFVRASAFSALDGFFWTLLTVLLLLVTPSRALGALQLEVTTRTIDLLLLTRLNAWRIVVAKWGSLILQALLLLVAVLPYGIVRYFGGSVDLVRDAQQCLALLAGCGLLTAAGLWGAGLGKLFRFVGLGGVIAVSSLGRTLLAGFSGIGSLSGVFSTVLIVLLCYDGALLLLFFLVAAVRNIAPPAENHSLLARSLPLLALAPVLFAPVVLPFAGSPVVAVYFAMQLLFAALFLGLVCFAELSKVQQPMAVHIRAALKLSALSRVLLRMTLPGWPSALLYALLSSLLWAACAVSFALVASSYSTVVVNGVAGAGPFRLGNSQMVTWPWLAVLALEALAYPAIVLSALRKPPRQPGGLYFVLIGAGGTMLALGYALAVAYPRLDFLPTVLSILPVASLIVNAFPSMVLPNPAIYLVQALVAVGVLFVAWHRTRPYWIRLDSMVARIRSEPDRSTPDP
jgi:hypothetical protein